MAKKILVIDDEGLVTKSIKKLLAKEGFDVVIAQSGKEAIEKFKALDFDLIICDVRMPELNGIETIEKIREVQKNIGKKSIPEVVITGYADEENYKKALELKVADYIFKPFDTNEFLQAVKRNLDVTKR